MAGAHLLNTSTLTLNEILGNGKIYRVPQFQRDYSWTEDNWEDLWNDVLNAQESKQPHYMGAIVLQEIGNKEFKIIDGQQRFSTLSVLILAFIDAIKSLVDQGIDTQNNEERVKLLFEQFIGRKDPSSLRYSSKLFLNQNNDHFYQTRLVNFKEPISIPKLSFSEALIWKAYSYFKGKIREHFPDRDGAELASFLNKVVGELMIFIQITVDDEINAYTVFETLNSRGVELTSTDLLKNYLFSLVSGGETDLKHVIEQWKKIIDIIGLKDFPVFLRYFIQATRKQITKDYLFRELKSFIKTADDVFSLLDQLEKYAYNYVALGSQDDDYWNEDKEIRFAIEILRVFRVTQWKILAMVAKEKLEKKSFLRLVNSLVSLTYRYNVIAKQQTNEMEKVFSRAAIDLFNSPKGDIVKVLRSIKSLYVDDSDFVNFFKSKQFNTNNSVDKKLARYTLYKIESQQNDKASVDFESDSGTIEHILPESFPESWQDVFSEEEYNRNVFLIGNLTLLEQSKNNKEAANRLFLEKLDVYKSSKYKITNSLSSEEWTSKQIKNRQAQLAKNACGVWKIQF